MIYTAKNKSFWSPSVPYPCPTLGRRVDRGRPLVPIEFVGAHIYVFTSPFVFDNLPERRQ